MQKTQMTVLASEEKESVSSSFHLSSHFFVSA